MPNPTARERFFAVLHAAVHDGTLVKLTLGKPRGADETLRNVFVRPVALKSGPHFAFVWRHATRDVTKNHAPADALAQLDALIGRDFLDAHLFTTTQQAQYESQPDGSARVKITAAAQPRASEPAGNDRTKMRAIDSRAPWLRVLGVTNERGQPREGMADKFRQIQKFAELLSHLLDEAFPHDTAGATGRDARDPASPRGNPTAVDSAPLADATPATDASSASSPSAGASPIAASSPGSSALASERPPSAAASQSRALLRVADMGSGKGYLTFALADVLGDRATVSGIEARPELVSLCNRVARETGFGGSLHFEAGTIAATPLAHCDVLIALHACDTATDDALARGIAAGAQLLVVSPCCQKELRPQLTAPPVLADALRHGIFQERQAEFVTDALRAQLLEWAGYRTKVFEFISTEHTAKNLMIAAIKTRPPGASDDARAQRVRDFARFYGIRRHHLAAALGFPLSAAAATVSARAET